MYIIISVCVCVGGWVREGGGWWRRGNEEITSKKKKIKQMLSKC